ncbi:NAD(P)-binding protein [Athelia psychrophila]|uniref:NAD(P)-binding protein n=1 Tax=Athelia psychrophila TaxID=1759441 RepID=A0A166LWR0_9AGAM|nr:NAD(P)-binding protein [Fibularhizoctonia sp. CBS 109695]KZP23396.1 NAD(P)-binding protein [Fibularhizoctonia sp. CBS 109695]
MSLKLAGKVAIVTGSSRSIGAAIAQRLAEDGANVIINYLSNSQAADSVVDGINSKAAGKAVAVKADVSSSVGAAELIEATIKAFGKLDILVLNAGIMGSKVLADVDEQFFDSHIQVNVKGPLFLSKAAAPLLPSGGRIIFFSSSLTKASSVLPNALVYVASKGAIEQISRVLAKDLGARGITVNTVSPGPVDTALFREGKTEQQIQFIAGLHPAKRLGTPDEIAPAVAFLASPDATWVNGQNLLVNGGFVV